MFQVVSEATVNAELSQLQTISLNKGEAIVEYSNRIMELVSGLKCAGHSITSIKQKRGLLRGLPEKFDVAAEVIMSARSDYHLALSKLIDRETRLQEMKSAPE